MKIPYQKNPKNFKLLLTIKQNSAYYYTHFTKTLLIHNNIFIYNELYNALWVVCKNILLFNVFSINKKRQGLALSLFIFL